MRPLIRSLLLSRVTAGVIALLGFVLPCLLGEAVLQGLLRDRQNQQSLEALSFAANVRVHLERELGALLNLDTGLVAYLSVGRGKVDEPELQSILAELYRNSRHANNFAIAEGYRVKYVYPLAGNERALGLYYPDRPDQYAVISRIAATGQPGLAGPLTLVQGGEALVYRAPVIARGRYWGLVSTVINHNSLFAQVQREVDDPRFEFAVRGRDGEGAQGAAVWGSLDLFSRPDLLTQNMDVPGGQWQIGVRVRAAPDTWVLRWSMRAAAFAMGVLGGLLLFVLMRNRARMAHQALYDALTGLPNRRLFEDRALMAFSRQQRSPRQLCALLFLDLDGFKRINDQYGHKAGDAILTTVAARALAAVRQNDTVARWGGDEFIVLLENVSPDMLTAIARRLRDSVQDPMNFEGRELRVGVSIGQALYPDSGPDLDALLHAADEEMYRDKAQRKGGLSLGGALAE